MDEQNKVNFINSVENEAEGTAPAFASVETSENESIKASEPIDAFAQGLPDWDVVPPQVMVRRR